MRRTSPSASPLATADGAALPCARRLSYRFPMDALDRPHDGGCTCRFVRYRMRTGPLFVHCCHCRWCQRETGASFALNAMIEADRVVLLEE